MRRSILVVCNDLHSGNRYGLLNPATILYEKDRFGNIIKDYHPELNLQQLYLWELFISCRNQVRELAGTDDVVMALNGDLTDGDKHIKSSMVVSNRIADQMIIGRWCLEPWFDLPTLKAVRIVKGTGAHNFELGSSEIVVTEMLKALHPNTSVEICDHSLIEFNGLTADISHHGPFTGSRVWLRGNVARYYLQDLMLQEIMAGKVPPKLVLRAHYHDFIKETVTMKNETHWYESTIMVIPSFAFLSDHAQQVMKSPARITHGMVALEIVDGEILRTHKMLQTLDMRTREVL